MPCQKIQLPIGCFERKRAVDSGVLSLHKRDASQLLRRSNECDCHFIRDIECFDQHGFVSFEPDGIFHKKFGEIVPANIVHKTVMIPSVALDATEAGPKWRAQILQQRHGQNDLQTEANTSLLPSRKIDKSARTHRTASSFSSGSRLQVLP